MRVGVGEVRMFASRREWTGQAGGRLLGGGWGRTEVKRLSVVLTPPPCAGLAAGGECRAESRGPP